MNLKSIRAIRVSLFKVKYIIGFVNRSGALFLNKNPKKKYMLEYEYTRRFTFFFLVMEDINL